MPTAWLSSPCFPSVLQKGLTVLAVAKRFGTAGTGRGETGARIAIFKAVLNVRPANELLQEGSVVTVACPDGIDALDGGRSGIKTGLAAFCDCALRCALD